MSFEVEITQQGPGGVYYYVELGVRLPFEWEFSSDGLDIAVPTPGDWNAFCANHNARFAANRRHEILERVAEQVRKRKVKSAKVAIDDHYVSLSWKDPWIFSVFKWLFSDAA